MSAPAHGPVPAGACDAHVHVLDPAFPAAAWARLAGDATAVDYACVRERLGTRKHPPLIDDLAQTD